VLEVGSDRDGFFDSPGLNVCVETSQAGPGWRTRSDSPVAKPAVPAVTKAIRLPVALTGLVNAPTIVLAEMPRRSRKVEQLHLGGKTETSSA